MMGFYVWYADIEEIDSEENFQHYISKISETEKTSICRFRIKDDQKRALLSVLLQRSLIRYHFNIGDSEYDIQRTRENKPFPNLRSSNKTTWNYNVSHHGKFVCIASHSKYLVGADLVDILTRTRMINTSKEYFEMFKGVFHPSEFAAMQTESCENARYTKFFVNWSLKEAFIKAIGIGLGYNLLDVRFEVNYRSFCASESGGTILSGSAIMFVKNECRDDWRFDFKSLDDRHVMTLALGPLSEALESYRLFAWAGIPDMPTETKSSVYRTLTSSKNCQCICKCCICPSSLISSCMPTCYSGQNKSTEERMVSDSIDESDFAEFSLDRIPLPRPEHKSIKYLMSDM